MVWLLHNYFLPVINPASASRHEAPLRPLVPILRQYKAVMKIITRDASLRTHYKQQVNTVIRDIERWIAEAKVAANIVVGEVGWETSEAPPPENPSLREEDDSIDLKEKWALEQFCGALLEKGGLVPLSKKCVRSSFCRLIVRKTNHHTESEPFQETNFGPHSSYSHSGHLSLNTFKFFMETSLTSFVRAPSLSFSPLKPRILYHHPPMLKWPRLKPKATHPMKCVLPVGLCGHKTPGLDQIMRMALKWDSKKTL